MIDAGVGATMKRPSLSPDTAFPSPETRFPRPAQGSILSAFPCPDDAGMTRAPSIRASVNKASIKRQWGAGL